MNDNPRIKAHVRLENGRLISKANAPRLIVRGTKDISKNVLGLGFTPDYREIYVVMHEPKGWIFREVNHGMGIAGHCRTLRDLVRKTTCSWLGFEIEVLPEPLPRELFAAVQERVQRLESDTYPKRPLGLLNPALLRGTA